jgi:ketosteroid isomerase-like protein
MSDLEANKKVAKDYADALNSGDNERFLNMFNDDLDYWMPGNWQMGGHHTKSDLRRMLTEHKVTMDEPMKFTITGLTAEGDRVAVEAVSSAKNNGKTYSQTYHLLIVIKNGKISKLHEYLDTKHAIEFFFG